MKFQRSIYIIIPFLVFSKGLFIGAVYGDNTSTNIVIKDSEECGTILIPEDIETIKNRSYYGRSAELASKTLMALNAPVGIPLAIHVVRRSDGSGGLSEDRVNQAVTDTNTNYRNVEMHFFIDGNINYINSDTYYDINNPFEADTLRNTYNIPNKVNLYFVNYAMGYCGFSTFSWYTVQGVIIANDCAGLPTNPSTVPHEIGHYFDLFHTHEIVFGIEFVNGTNCAVAGDLLCDTPADPNLNGKVDTFCIYTWNDIDPNGDPYNPDTYNLMSYSRKTCRDYTSPQQAVRQTNTLINDRPELLVLPDIKANDSDGPINLGVGSPLTVKVSLDAGVRSGEPAEWWIGAFTPFGNYWFTLPSGWVKSATPLPVGGGATTFFSLSPYIILNNYIMTNPGSYMLGIALDSNVSSTLDLQYYDMVNITVQ